MAQDDINKVKTPSTVQLPAPTAWPFTLAAGLSLIMAALVTNVGLAYLGLALSVVSAVGWLRQILPHEKHEAVELVTEPIEVATTRVRVARIQMDEIAMIIPAEMYGLLRFHSLWYPVNLLGGMGAFGDRNPTVAELSQFHLTPFLIALVIHVSASLLVGLLYGALLPVWPTHPILLGGIVAPALWTGLLYSILSIVNPFFNQRISWPWFATSQLFFGLVAGWTVTRRGRIKRLAQLPLAIRLGLEAPGLHGRPRGRQDGTP